MSIRWNLEMRDNFNLVAIPKAEEISNFVYQASKDLTYKIMQAEEELVLQSLSALALKRMIKLCSNELKRRRSK